MNGGQATAVSMKSIASSQSEVRVLSLKARYSLSYGVFAKVPGRVPRGSPSYCNYPGESQSVNPIEVSPVP